MWWLGVAARMALACGGLASSEGGVEVLAVFELPRGGDGPLGWTLDEVSAIDWSSQGILYAMGDDRSESGPARVAEIELGFTRDGPPESPWRPRVGGLRWHALASPEGGGFRANTVDPEALRGLGRVPLPDGGFAVEIAFASEGHARTGVPPAVFRMTLGALSSERFDAPVKFAPVGESRGIAHNRGFESLAVRGGADGLVLVTATEQPLLQDRPEDGAPGVVRLVVLDTNAERGRTPIEFGFPLGPGAEDDKPGSHALAELVAVGPNSFLALENAEGRDGSGRARLSWVSDLGATNLAGIDSLRGDALGGAHLMTKRAVVDFADLGVTGRADDWEGMTLGPELDGRRTLIVCEDNGGEGANRVMLLSLPGWVLGE